MELSKYWKIHKETEKRIKEQFGEDDLPEHLRLEQEEGILETVCNENKITLSQFYESQEEAWRQAHEYQEDEVVKFISQSGRASQNQLFEKFGFDSAEHIQKLETFGVIRSQTENNRIMFSLSNPTELK